MLAIIRTIGLSALRERLYFGLVAALTLCVLFSLFLGGTALSEQVQTGIVLFGGSARLVVVLGLVLLVVFYMQRADEGREVEVILSTPITRTRFVLAHYLGFSLLAVVLVLPLAPVLWAMGLPHPLVGLGWTVSLLLEALIMVAAALLFSLLLKSAVNAVLASAAFYVLGRLIGYFVMASMSGLSGAPHETITQKLMLAISTVMPRLDFFADTHWLIYGFDTEATFTKGVLQAGIYIPLLLVITIFDFRKRQF